MSVPSSHLATTWHLDFEAFALIKHRRLQRLHRYHQQKEGVRIDIINMMFHEFAITYCIEGASKAFQVIAPSDNSLFISWHVDFNTAFGLIKHIAHCICDDCMMTHRAAGIAR
jgi:hypothetical protein